MTNTYIDIFDFTRSTSGLEYQSLIGNQARFPVAQTAGATSLTGIPAIGPNSVTVQLNQFDRIWIFDGTNTEVVQVGSAGAGIGATSIPLLAGTSLQFSHAIGVAWCSDGTAGSLADQIVEASAWIERTCYQPLLQATYTNEAIDMPTPRANINNRGSLTFRPWHWPISSVSGISMITSDPQNPTGFDTSKVFILGDKRLCRISQLTALPGQGRSNNIDNRILPDRNTEAQLLLTYTAGYVYSTLPPDLKEATILVTSDQLAKRHNSIGAPDIADGSTHISAALRGDTSGESLLIKRALKILSKYSVSQY